jgi:hypothetical protein
MAKKDNNTEELEFEGMPGADPKTEEDAAPFQVDMNFEEEPEVTEEEVEEETEEEVVGEETTEEVAEEQVEEVATEQTEDEEEGTEPESVQGDDEQPVEAVEEGPEEVEETKAPMVPKSRLDEVLAKNKEMQKKLQDIESEKSNEPEVPAYDFVSKEKAYQDLVLEGETNKAALLRQEIRAAEKEQLMSEMKSQMGQTVQQDRENHELAAKAQEIVDVFPVFNEKSKQYDEKLTAEVMELRDAFIYQGYGAADSLAKATEVTLLSKRPELLQGADVAEDPAPQLSKVVQEKKQKATVRKKVEAAQAQPPAMKGESAKNKKVVDINVMSDDEFGALPEDTLRRLRGDFD